jgi:hypothetical protein
MKSERDDRDREREPASATKVHDDVWGDSTEGPVRGEGTPEPGGTWARDERLDPWGGPPVQNVDALPSGDPVRPVPVDPDATHPDDEKAGGFAGVVGRDDRLKRQD